MLSSHQFKMAFRCYQNLRVVLLVLLAIQLNNQGVSACGGHWSTAHSVLVVPPGWPRYTHCDYGGRKMGQTPTDIREDTEFLK